MFRKHSVPLGKIHHPWTVPEIAEDLKANERLSCYANPKYEQKQWKSHYSRDGRNEENKRGGQNGKRGGRGKGRGRGKPRGGGQDSKQYAGKSNAELQHN